MRSETLKGTAHPSSPRDDVIVFVPPPPPPPETHKVLGRTLVERPRRIVRPAVGRPQLRRPPEAPAVKGEPHVHLLTRRT